MLFSSLRINRIELMDFCVRLMLPKAVLVVSLMFPSAAGTHAVIGGL